LRGPVITVSGPHGTGKSTYAKALAEAFQLRYVSAGEFFRDLAREKGVSLEVFSKMAAENPAVDKIIDERTKAEAQKGGVVIDAQLGGWMAKELADLKVLIVASDDVRFRRIAARDGIPFEEARKQTLAREAFQRQRYEKYYGIDVTDLSIYDVKVDTGSYPLEKAKSIVIDRVRRQLGKSKLTSS
jgi:cytidylate kinase